MPAGGQWMTPLDGGAPEWVPDSLLARANDSGFYKPLPGDTPVAIDSAGLKGQVSLDDLGRLERGTGARPQTGAEFREGETAARNEREYGGLGSELLTIGEQAVDTLSLGAYQGLARKLAPGYAERMQLREDTNPIASGVTNAAAIVGSTALSGGTSLLAKGVAAGPGAIARMGAGVAAKGAGGSAAKRIGMAGAGLGVEGIGLGAAQATEEVFDTDDPVEMEKLASLYSSKMLINGVAGGAFGILGKAAEIATGRVGKAMATKAGRPAAAPGIADDVADVPHMSLPEVQAARTAEEEAIKAAAVKQQAASIADGPMYRAAVKDKNPHLVINEGRDAKTLIGVNRKIENALDDPRGFAKNPEKILEPLRRQEGVFERAIANADDIGKTLAAQEQRHARALAEELDTLPSSATEVVLKGKVVERYGTWSGKKFTRANQAAGVAIPREDAAGLLNAMRTGEIATARGQALKELPALLEQNRAWQKSIEAAASADKVVTPRLKALMDQAELIKAGASAPKSLGERMTHAGLFGGATMLAGAAGVPGMMAPVVGAWVAEKGAGLLFQRLGKATAEQAARTAKAIDAFVTVGTKTTRHGPALATRVLSQLSYGDAPKKPAPPPGFPSKPKKQAEPKGKDKLVAEFQRVAAEIRSQMDGPRASMPARRRIAANVAGVAQLSPKMADYIETLAARRLEFLASKLPTHPDLAAMQTGPKKWGTSMMQVRAFARYAAAVEDPGGVEERLVDGSVTPEDAEAYRSVYPERYADFQRRLIERMAFLQETLPYRRRLALSIFSGVPVDPAMHPMVLKTLQASYAEEPGTEGGMSAPMAQPQMGSISKPEPTAAQKRAG